MNLPSFLLGLIAGVVVITVITGNINRARVNRLEHAQPPTAKRLESALAALRLIAAHGDKPSSKLALRAIEADERAEAGQ